jgi:hypothetical protein
MITTIATIIVAVIAFIVVFLAVSAVWLIIETLREPL